MRPVPYVLLCMIALAAFALAADEKRPTTQKVEGWGELVDPDGDCKLQRDEGGRVTLEVPAGTHDLWPEGQKVNAPRLVQPIRGDFTVQVKVIGSMMPKEGTEVAGRELAFRAATLLIWQDENNFVRLDRAGMLNKRKPFSQTYYHIFQAGKRTAHLYKLAPHEGDLWLRLQRKGDTLVAGWSEDGKAWTDYPPQEAKLAGDVQVGVAALNVSSAPSAATFETVEMQPKPPP